MADQIHLRLGAPPWKPAHTARLLKTLNHYDIPLAGILKQHGTYYLFECLRGETQEANVWAYVPITRPTARKLRRLTGDQLTNAMHAAYQERTVTAALAINGQIELGECIDLRQRQELRVEAMKAVKSKAHRDVSAVDGLVALV